jgi:hypothetical protein
LIKIEFKKSKQRDLQNLSKRKPFGVLENRPLFSNFDRFSAKCCS